MPHERSCEVAKRVQIGCRMSAVAGPLLLAAPVALAAGAVSFASPCVLPLVPGYLSYVTGMSGADVSGSLRRSVLRSRTALGAVLFVLGFSVVFVAYGAAFGGLGAALREHQRGLQETFGVITILLGLTFAGVLSRLPVTSREFRVHRMPAAGLAGAPVLGVLFGLGWTPCIGPTLSTVLTLAASDSHATAGRGALLTVFYCLGLGVPFVVVALAFRRAMGALALFRRHGRGLMLAGGTLLVLIGVLEVTGSWNTIVNNLQATTTGFTPSL